MAILRRLTAFASAFAALGAFAWSDADVKDLVKWHNIFRCMHGVPPVRWSDALAANAGKWAKHTKGEMVHSSPQEREDVAGFMYVGESLYKAMPASAVSGRDAVEAWYSEIKDSDGGRVADFDPNTGHYTQVVWKESTTIGCGYYDGLVACQYGPGGNMQGDFEDNVKPPAKSMKQCGGPEKPLPIAGSHEVGKALEEDCLNVLQTESAFEPSYSAYCSWGVSDFGHTAVAMPADCMSLQVAAGPDAKKDALKQCGSGCEIVDADGKSCGGTAALISVSGKRAPGAFRAARAGVSVSAYRDSASRDGQPAEQPVFGLQAFLGLASGVVAFSVAFWVLSSRQPAHNREPLITAVSC